jgi:hypothetical protein
VASRSIPVQAVGARTGPRAPFGLRELILIASLGLAFAEMFSRHVTAVAEGAPEGRLLLVPVIAAALAWIQVRRAPPPLPINDRQVDVIVGVELLLVAVFVRAVGGSGGSPLVDQLGALALAFALATAGAVAVLYGVRRLWTVRWAIAFLLLLWPAAHAPLDAAGAMAAGWLGMADPGSLGGVASVVVPAMLAIGWASATSFRGRALVTLIAATLGSALVAALLVAADAVLPLYPAVVGVTLLTISVGVARTTAVFPARPPAAAGGLRVAFAVVLAAAIGLRIVGGTGVGVSADDPLELDARGDRSGVAGLEV